MFRKIPAFAAWTFPIKISNMSFYLAVKILTGKDVDMIQSAYLQVENTSTAVTGEMVVWSGVSVKTVRSDSCRKLLDFSNIGKQRQITVNCAKTDIGELFPNVCINSFCSRVIISGGKEILNGFPLSAIFQHGYHPFANNSNCY